MSGGRAVRLLVGRELMAMTRSGRVWMMALVLPSILLLQMLFLGWVRSLADAPPAPPSVHVAVVDEAGVWDALALELESVPEVEATRLAASARTHGEILDDFVRDGIYDAWVLLPGDFLAGGRPEVRYDGGLPRWTYRDLSRAVGRSALRASWSDEGPSWLMERRAAARPVPGGSTTWVVGDAEVIRGAALALPLLTLFGVQVAAMGAGREQDGLNEILGCAVSASSRVVARATAHTLGGTGLLLTTTTTALLAGFGLSWALFGPVFPWTWVSHLGLSGIVSLVLAVVALTWSTTLTVEALEVWPRGLMALLLFVALFLPLGLSIGWGASGTIAGSLPSWMVWVPVAGVPGAWIEAQTRGAWWLLLGCTTTSALVSWLVAGVLVRVGRMLRLAGGYLSLRTTWRAAWRSA